MKKKLTPEQVREIRDARAHIKPWKSSPNPEHTVKALAAKFEVSTTVVSSVARGRAYRNVYDS